jgi:hypothetical protein
MHRAHNNAGNMRNEANEEFFEMANWFDDFEWLALEFEMSGNRKMSEIATKIEECQGRI